MDLFHLDETPEAKGPSSSSPVPSSAATPPPEAHDAPDSHHANEGIAMERRVVPLLEYSEDTCSICLDDYTKEDPGAPTVCGHHFHLQCIMQWAQRSRECPLCFRALQLQDEDMNCLLPFGEYVSPEQRAAEQASLETWELERLLLRLAAASQGHHHRSHRAGRRATTGTAAAAAAAGGGSSSGRHRRQGSRGEASAPRPIRGSGADAAAADEGSHGWLLGDGAGSAASGGGRPASAPGPGFPASWPPAAAGGSEPSSSGAGGSGAGVQDDGHVLSSGSRSGSFSLKSRLASLRLKDKFEKTTKELRSLFSPGSHSSDRRSDGATPH